MNSVTLPSARQATLQKVVLPPDSLSIVTRFLRLEDLMGVPKDLASLVASYAIDAIHFFGAVDWKRYYGVDVGPEPALSNKFFEWWLSGDHEEPGQLNCETHLPPVLRPEQVIETDVVGNKTLSDFSHKTLARLVERPKEGPPSRYILGLDDLQEHAHAKAGPSRWCVMRKKIFAKNQSFAEQREDLQKRNRVGAGYDEMPSALDLATVVFAAHVRSRGQDRYLGDLLGKEREITYSRCEETVQIGQSPFSLKVGGFAESGLMVICAARAASPNTGVAGLRRF